MGIQIRRWRLVTAVGTAIVVAVLQPTWGQEGDGFPKPAELPAHSALPDPLVMLDGRKVSTPEMWINERRPELIRLFQHFMYGPSGRLRRIGSEPGRNRPRKAVQYAGHTADSTARDRGHINDNFPHWFNARFKEFNSQPERLPFDQNCLAALCASRPVLFTNGRADTWINPAGQLEVLRAAVPVYLIAEGR